MPIHNKGPRISGIGFALQETLIVTTDNIGRIVLWSKSSGEPLSILELPLATSESGRQLPRRIESLSISPDMQAMAVGTNDEVLLFDISTLQEIRSWVDPHRNIFRASFSPTSNLLAISSRYDHTDIWDLDEGKCIQTLEGIPSGPLTQSAIAANNHFLATTYGTHSYARLWDIQSGQVLHHLTRDDLLLVSHIAFSNDSQFLLTSAHTKTACAILWNTASGTQLNIYGIAGRNAGAIAFAPDDRSFAIASYKEILVVSIETGEAIRRLVGHENTLMQVAFSKNGESLLSSSNDGTARLWDISTGQVIWQADLNVPLEPGRSDT